MHILPLSARFGEIRRPGTGVSDSVDQCRKGAERAHLAQKPLQTHYNPVGREEALRVRVSERVLSVIPGFIRNVRNVEDHRV